MTPRKRHHRLLLTAVALHALLSSLSSIAQMVDGETTYFFDPMSSAKAPSYGTYDNTALEERVKGILTSGDTLTKKIRKPEKKKKKKKKKPFQKLKRSDSLCNLFIVSE